MKKLDGFSIIFRCLFLIGVLVFPSAVAAQLVIQLTEIPDLTPLNDPIFVAGPFNDWNPGDDNYQFRRNSDGVLEVEIDLDPGKIAYKFTRGSWQSVEGGPDGKYIPNRANNYGGGLQVVTEEILGWENLVPKPASTAEYNVRILDDDLFIPQLNKHRQIWVYLPPDYYSSSKQYPVIYMHDAQNLFDKATSFSGEWEVDETLNRLFLNGNAGCIVIGIENGGQDRLKEYNPWVHASYGGGEGDEYMAFIVETLKPLVDQNFRTLSDRRHTGIIGSSLGGLISQFGIVEYQEVFGFAGVFSPSFWLTPEIFNYVEKEGAQFSCRIALIAGDNESATMVPNLYKMRSSLIKAGFRPEHILMKTYQDGAHSEWFWGREFPVIYQWLVPPSR